MKVYHKVIDDRSEYFFGSIPAWITRFAFITMLFLFSGLFVTSYLVNVPDRKSVAVTISRNSAVAKLDYATFKNIKNQQQINIDLPLYGVINADLDLKNAYLSGENVFCNIYFNKKFDATKIKGTLNCSGEILLSNTSILKKILSK